MKKCLILALSSGSHLHTYPDASGVCSGCGKTHTPHDFSTGAFCRICGFGCDHSAGFRSHDSENHFCIACSMIQPHEPDYVHGDKICTECSVCGISLNNHSFSNRNADCCGICDQCGDTFPSHDYTIYGYCRRCSYQCPHSKISGGVCSVCGCNVVHYQATWYVLTGTYAGSYIRVSDPENESPGITFYQRYNYSPASGTWSSSGKYLAELQITEPTNYGGEYYYTCPDGFVFCDTMTNFPVNDTLLSGSGKNINDLSQYDQDGTLRATQSYKSADFPAIYRR